MVTLVVCENTQLFRDGAGLLNGLLAEVLNSTVTIVFACTNTLLALKRRRVQSDMT